VAVTATLGAVVDAEAVVVVLMITVVAAAVIITEKVVVGRGSSGWSW